MNHVSLVIIINRLATRQSGKANRHCIVLSGIKVVPVAIYPLFATQVGTIWVHVVITSVIVVPGRPYLAISSESVLVTIDGLYAMEHLPPASGNTSRLIVVVHQPTVGQLGETSTHRSGLFIKVVPAILDVLFTMNHMSLTIIINRLAARQGSQSNGHCIIISRIKVVPVTVNPSFTVGIRTIIIDVVKMVIIIIYP